MIGDIVRECISFVLYGLATIVSPFVPIHNPSHQADKTIVIVHGWMGSSLAQFLLRKYLQNHGFCVYFADFGLHTSPIAHLAQQLDIFMEKNQLKDVYLLGISDGGIICWEYLETYNTWKNIKKFVALVTPFQGSWISRVAFFSKAAQQIATGSNFISTVKNAKLPFPQKAVSITGTWDEFVFPKSTKKNQVQSIVVPEGGHAYLQIFSQKVYEAILREIN